MVRSPTQEEPRSYLAQQAALPEIYLGGQKADKRPTRLMGRKHRHLYEKMLGFLRDGASLKASCEVIGLTYGVAQDWIRKAEGLAPNTAFARFRRDVQQAQAVARSAAEIHIKKRDPKAWLQANAGDMWHPDRQSQIINVDARKVAYIEQTDTGDLAKTMAVLEQLGMAPAIHKGGAAPDTEQENNVLEADKGNQ